MTTYKVLESFEDLQDLRHPYLAGSLYPRSGYVPSAERIAELTSANNKRGRAVIEALEQTDKVSSAPAQSLVDEAVDEVVDEAVDESVKVRRGRRKKKNAD